MTAPTTPPRTTTPGALALADDALILAQRLGEWAGHAPVLEEDVALANIALDLLGQARVLYSLLGDEDELAYLREERAFRNTQLVEQPNGDFAHTIARQLYFSTYQHLLHTQLATAELPEATTPAGTTALEIQALATKAAKETAYHREHAELWTLRLGDGTTESHDRMQRAVDTLWRHTGELFQDLEGIQLDLPTLESDWHSSISQILHRATLTVPDGPRSGAWTAGAGRQGIHTEPFGRMLAEMQHLHRSHPGASW
ncbi:1,2-phenylacetyl-CoA epoxidase, subunit C [Streptomyces sp. YIM 130001]|uniref:1,2-phenylacetyl-CoA epoxidase subunit PaaC n=1 Tax=Streptomyces sp. YIM 130001 TaxID=2259644 RepID=UPI000E65272D|nr:1,2-phenylacetyl-CoA epoxidase subunit PaaC [Streptomyces sp. YIM 130001]RII11267.1 1,2-phenylacetyl-CoA epoxidase, subunit C [Streptomyces sp. YIM 130001]